jgi:signal transduction histidine kinase
MTERSNDTERPPGIWQTLRAAEKAAPRSTRRALVYLALAVDAMLLLYFVLDFKGLQPMELVEAASVVLGATGMACLGSVLLLQHAQQRAAGEGDVAWAETKLPTQIALVLPVAAAAGAAALAGSIGMTLVRAALGSPEHFIIAGFMTVYLGVIGRIIFGSTRSLYLYGQRQAAAAERARAELAEARMTALQAQMNPHFLFNTLNTVASLVRRDARAAETTVEDLAHVMRRTLDRSARPLSTVADEIDYVRAWLAIEQQRMGDRLAVAWQVDPMLVNRSMPTMTLQPIIENALKHGVGAKLEGGTIQITVMEAADGLRVIVEDDGPGFVQRHREGTGLGNLRERLRTQYGKAAQLRIEHPARGARVVVDLPPTLTLAGR